MDEKENNTTVKNGGTTAADITTTPNLMNPLVTVESSTETPLLVSDDEDGIDDRTNLVHSKHSKAQQSSDIPRPL